MSAASTRRSRSGPAIFVAVVLLIGAILPSWSPSPRAAGAEPARVRVAAPLIDDLMRGLLPIDLVLPASIAGSADGGVSSSQTAALLTELRYCGVTDKGLGRFRAVIRAGGFGGDAAPSVLMGDDGCRQSLGDLAKHLPAAASPDGGGIVADLEAAWRPWELRFTIARTAGPTPPKPGLPRPLAIWDTRHDLLTVATAGFRVPTEAGQSLTFHAAPSFAADSVEIAAILGENGAGPPSARPTIGGAVAGLSTDVNVVVELPYTLANQVLRQFAGMQPLPIRVDREVIDVQNVSIAPAGPGVMVTGAATPRSIRETVRLTVQTGGADLRVTSLRADPQLENCAGLSVLAAIGCNTRNAGRGAAAAAFGAAMTQKLQGQLVRELAGPQDFRFDGGTRRLTLQGDLRYTGAGPRGLSFGARLAAGDPGH
jgi:hypothetical protein